MLISDWMSDVCSSDLLGDVVFSVLLEAELGQKRAIIELARNLPHRFGRVQNPLRVHPGQEFARFRKHAHPFKAHRIEPFEDVAILAVLRSEEHTSELKSLMRTSYAFFCLKKKKTNAHTKQKRPKSSKKKPCTYKFHKRKQSTNHNE